MKGKGKLGSCEDRWAIKVSVVRVLQPTYESNIRVISLLVGPKFRSKYKILKYRDPSPAGR